MVSTTIDEAMHMVLSFLEHVKYERERERDREREREGDWIMWEAFLHATTRMQQVINLLQSNSLNYPNGLVAHYVIKSLLCIYI